MPDPESSTVKCIIITQIKKSSIKKSKQFLTTFDYYVGINSIHTLIFLIVTFLSYLNYHKPVEPWRADLPEAHLSNAMSSKAIELVPELSLNSTSMIRENLLKAPIFIESFVHCLECCSVVVYRGTIWSFVVFNSTEKWNRQSVELN